MMMIKQRKITIRRFVIILLLLMLGTFFSVSWVFNSGRCESSPTQNIKVDHKSDYITAYDGKHDYGKEGVALRNIMDQINKPVIQDKDLEDRLGEKDSCYEYRRSAMKRRPVAYDVLRHIRAPLLTNDSITFISHMTYNRMYPLMRVIQNWDGPISVAIYINKSLIPEMLDTFEKMDFIRNSTILLHVVPMEEELYPVNYMRNIALNASTTRYVFLMDIDFIPMPRAHHVLMKYVKPNRHQVLVVPAFEDMCPNSIPILPQNKSDLMKMWKKKTVIPFRTASFFYANQILTNFDRWKRQDTEYIIDAARNFKFEPYIVGERSKLPPYSELFAGRGFNKIQHLLEVTAMKFEYVVCPEVFSIHLWHAKASLKGEACSLQSKRVFLEYVKEKYGFGPGSVPELTFNLIKVYQLISIMLSGDD